MNNIKHFCKKLRFLFTISHQLIFNSFQKFFIIDFPVDHNLLKKKNIIKFYKHNYRYIVNTEKKKYNYSNFLKLNLLKDFSIQINT
jgi:hypothetical protein